MRPVLAEVRTLVASLIISGNQPSGDDVRSRYHYLTRRQIDALTCAGCCTSVQSRDDAQRRVQCRLILHQEPPGPLQGRPGGIKRSGRVISPAAAVEYVQA